MKRVTKRTVPPAERRKKRLEKERKALYITAALLRSLQKLTLDTL